MIRGVDRPLEMRLDRATVSWLAARLSRDATWAVDEASSWSRPWRGDTGVPPASRAEYVNLIQDH
jgi:hypothetical protein